MCMNTCMYEMIDTKSEYEQNMYEIFLIFPIQGRFQLKYQFLFQGK